MIVGYWGLGNDIGYSAGGSMYYLCFASLRAMVLRDIGVGSGFASGDWKSFAWVGNCSFG